MSKFGVMGLMATGLVFGMPACVPGGGGCTYTSYSGTCTGQADGTFSFEGTVKGSALTLLGNTLGATQTLDEGKSVSCSLKAMDTGTCTPCIFDIGEAGKDAWDVCNGL